MVIKGYPVPVLIIGFNRSDTFQIVFDKVKKVKPQKLYLAVDGPRNDVPTDKENCMKVCDIAKQVDWECDIHTLFRKKNVGCGRGPSEAITWAFETCGDRLIILEDDCVPEDSFFSFCEELLERYKEDERVWLISGDCYYPEAEAFREYDYVFSNFAHTQGWATWKRCWDQFDIRMKDFSSFYLTGGANNVMLFREAGDLWNKKYKKVYDNIEKEVTHSWDSQWGYARLKNGGLGIVPKVHLIRYVGDYGTHSQGDSPLTKLETHEMPKVLKHPDFIIPIVGYEREYFSNYIRKRYPTKWMKIIKIIKSLFK